MAFTKVTAAGISTGNSLTIQELNTVGVITAATVQVGSATTIHTTGIDLGSGNITSHNINSTGIITATGAVITGNLQVEGTTTTLDSLVTEVDKLEVAANNTNVAVAVTQSGTGDILNLFDGSTEVFTVLDGGNVGIGTVAPTEKLSITGGTSTTFGLSLTPLGWNGAKHRLTVPVEGWTSMWSWNYDGSTVDNSLYATSAILMRSGYISLQTGTFNTAPTTRVLISDTGLVGINTSTPAAKLNVVTTSTDDAILMLEADMGTNNNRVLQFKSPATDSASDPFLIQTGNSIQFRIDSTDALKINDNGSVGIGTNAPGAKLQIHHQTAATFNDGNNALRIEYDGSHNPGQIGGGIVFAQHWYSDATSRVRTGGIYGVKDGGNGSYGGGLAFYTQPHNGGDMAEIMRLSGGSQNVGINTNNPQRALHVNGDIRISDNSARLEFYDTNASDNTNCTGGFEVYDANGNRGAWVGLTESGGNIHFGIHGTDVARINSNGKLILDYGVIDLGTADSSSGHINAYELMTFNIDSDNDDTNRHFTWYKNGASGSGTGMMRLNEDGRLIIGGDLSASANNLTLRHASTTELDMTCTGGSGNNFRIKSDSSGTFTIRDHSSGNDRITILDGGNIGLNQSSPDSRLHVVSSVNHAATFEYTSTSDMAIQLKNTQGSMFFGLGGGEEFAVATDSDLNGSNNLFVIRQDGNTGINNVSPAVKFAVADSTDVQMLLSSSWSGTQQILFGGSHNSSGAANSTAAIIKCTSSAPSGQAVGRLSFLVNNGDNFDDDRLIIYPQGLGNAKTNGGPALQIRSGNTGGGLTWSDPLRLQPQIYDADLGSGIFMFSMTPSCSDSTPTLVLRMRSGGIAHGEVTMQMCRRTNSPSNAQFRRSVAKYVFAMYGEGDNDGSGLRIHDELYEYSNSLTITQQSVIYVADSHPQYNTNTNGWLNGAHYLKYDFTGQQCVPVYIKIDMLFGAQYTWEAYWE